MEQGSIGIDLRGVRGKNWVNMIKTFYEILQKINKHIYFVKPEQLWRLEIWRTTRSQAELWRREHPDTDKLKGIHMQQQQAQLRQVDRYTRKANPLLAG